MKKALYKVMLFALIPLPFIFCFDAIIMKGLHKSRALHFAVWNDIYDSKINACQPNTHGAEQFSRKLAQDLKPLVTSEPTAIISLFF